MLYTYRAFLSGSKLDSLCKEIIAFIQLYSLYKRHTLRFSVAPFSNAIASLAGRKCPSFHETDDDILAKSLEVKELNVAETVVVCKMMCSLIFRKLDEAEQVAKQYMDFFEEHNTGAMQFINIYRHFYGGLIVSAAWSIAFKDVWY